MNETKPPTDSLPPQVSWLKSSIRHIRYGFTIIRQDGLVYFFKRLYQFISWQVKGAYQSMRMRLVTRGRGQFLKVEDIRLTSPLEQKDQAEFPESRPASGYHEELVKTGLTSHNQHLIERERMVQLGRQHFENRRVLFVSPIRVLGGGANSILLAAKAMQRMGVDAQIMNLNVHRPWFERNYPDLKLPVVFADVEDIPRSAGSFDAIIATSNPTVAWIASAAEKQPGLKVGYYIQDYEPYFYTQDSHEFRKATASYTLIPDLVRMVTTPWISEQIRLHHRIQSTIVGGHIDTDLFQPRPNTDPSWPDRPLRVTAMIRPATARRNPKLTMAILQRASKMYPSRVQIRLFGCDPSDPGFASLEQDFAWQLAGQLRSSQVANLFNEADIFVDFSDFQAFGLTAVEAMATGLAVVVPENGGTQDYAQNEENCLVVDTHDQEASFRALRRLIEDDALRLKLQGNAVSAAARLYAEAPALKMLQELFQGDE